MLPATNPLPCDPAKIPPATGPAALSPSADHPAAIIAGPATIPATPSVAAIPYLNICQLPSFF